MASRLTVLNGPNLNLLGVREPHIYGTTTLTAIEASCREFAATIGLSLTFHQSNHEGELIDWIHEAGAKKAAGVVINPGGYTHSSVAIRDAVAAVDIPVIEVHISNIFAREDFRHFSHIAPVAKATLSGFGVTGYALAIDGLAALNSSGRRS
jgi:3-dehydroquinate dehydratase II